ncbi:hypothetical protein CYLTODRAFT_425308 [Cylindrobasidium torrendii FP15055 ss-10]|uniref:C2H2-type domain-containing protein n=1 Tax=Cylindrobasidium torrendii FP15055 ss-10 TaxID=1314674 RepID=A0A0D7B135_9AGAR|nr:hypothetical protein CYLTODRAFT_425308 [Cylindrobasidium torrendii FP15055 ss-10]
MVHRCVFVFVTERGHSCDRAGCSSTSNKKWRLTAHKRRHGERPYICPYMECQIQGAGWNFLDKLELRAHSERNIHDWDYVMKFNTPELLQYASSLKPA